MANDKSAAPSTGAVASCEAQASGEGGDRSSVGAARIYPPLLPCPFCGGAASWCDCGGDCHQLQCVTCGWQIDNTGPEAHTAETLDACREVMARRWNTRYSPTLVEGARPDPSRSPAGDAAMSQQELAKTRDPSGSLTAGQEVAGHPTQGEQGEGR